jgi:hypothetical protein
MGRILGTKYRIAQEGLALVRKLCFHSSHAGRFRRESEMGDVVPYQVKEVAFDNLHKPDRGYAVRASYLEKPHEPDALIEIFKDGAVLRSFLFPAYKIWNIAAHFADIVDGEIANNASGYGIAASTGFGGSVGIKPVPHQDAPTPPQPTPRAEQ